MPTTDVRNLPDTAIPVAKQIEALGFKWTYEPEYKIPDQVLRVQVRDLPKGQAPSQEVTRYAAALKRGDKFPPGVVTKDGLVVDFNTRLAAARKLGWLYYPAFILDKSFEHGSSADRERIYLLGAAFNTKSGKRLDRDELTNIIRELVQDPAWTAERVAEHLGVASGTVKGIYAQVRAEQRAAALGVPFNGSVTASNKQAIGARSEKLDDAPFREIVKLVQDAGLTGSELKGLMGAVQEKGSERDKVAAIEEERRIRQDQISAFRAFGKKQPPKSVELRKRLGYIIGHGENVEELVDHNPRTQADYLEKVTAAADVLVALRDVQRQIVTEAASA